MVNIFKWCCNGKGNNGKGIWNLAKFANKKYINADVEKKMEEKFLNQRKKWKQDSINALC